MNIKTFYTVFLSILFYQITLKISYPCTTFLIKSGNEIVFGRNYDFMIGYGIIFVNKKSVVKTAFTENNIPAKWVSKYGSVTFNQFGREFPTGGINETGLVIELMWLDDTKYSEADDRPAAGGVLQWIQYQLDNCETIQEVIDTDKDIRIPARAVPIHFLIADKYGNSATIEFLNGKMVSHNGDELPYTVLTNDTYEKSLNYFKAGKYKIENGVPEDANNSLNRFARACSMLDVFKKDGNFNAVDYGFQILNSIKQGSSTKWSIVYDIRNMKIYFKTFNNSKLKNIDIVALDYDCSSPVKMIDVDYDFEGNINESLVEYDYNTNRKLIEDSYNGVEFLRAVGDEEQDKTAKYPDNLNCQSKSSADENSFKNNLTETNNNNEFPIYLMSGIILAFIIIARYKKTKTN